MKKKNSMESPVKKSLKLFYNGKNQIFFWFVNDSEYHHPEMGGANL